MDQEYGYLLSGKEVKSGDILAVENPYQGAVVASVHRADGKGIQEAIAAAQSAFPAARSLPSYKRAQILSQVSQSLANNAEDLARTIALEAGKPLSATQAEVDRCRFTFHVADELSERPPGAHRFSTRALPQYSFCKTVKHPLYTGLRPITLPFSQILRHRQY